VHLDAMLLMYSREADTNFSFAFPLFCSVTSGKDVPGTDVNEAAGMENVDKPSTL
jgi:hypothetical protein